MRLIRLAGASLLVAAVTLIVVNVSASAHERRDVADGQYRLVVGFLDEPAFSGQQNGLDLRVAKLDPAATPAAEGEDPPTTPVEGLESTLQAEVFYADQAMPLVISAAFGAPGSYESVFFPTQPGDYSFHVFGTIDGVAIDETFTSGPDTFGPMEDPAPLQFPKETAANASQGVAAASVSGPLPGGDDSGMGGTGLLLGSGVAGVVGLWVLARKAQNRKLTARTA
jgi:hypothetical protein